MNYFTKYISIAAFFSVLFFTQTTGQTTIAAKAKTKHECGVYKKSHQALVIPTRYDVHLSDRFGNMFVVEELQASASDDICESNSHFTLAFEGEFTDAERQTICRVFSDLSSLLDAQQGNILIKIIKQQLPEGVFGAGSPIYLEDPNSHSGSIKNSIVWDLINTQTDYSTALPDNFAAGVLRINNILPPGEQWHTIEMDNSNVSEENLTVEDGFVDLYTVAMHEALHILGFASRIMHDGTPYQGSYSRWDRLLYANDENHLDTYTFGSRLIKKNEDLHCTQYEFNHTIFPEMPADLYYQCSDEQNAFSIRFGGADGAIINANYNALAFNPDAEVRNMLSHINQECENGKHVMHYNIADGEHRRVISTTEKEILCQLGYSLTDSEINCGQCKVVAVDDEIIAQSMQFDLTTSNLLLNDVLPEGFDASSALTLDFLCGDAQMVDVQPLSNGWRIQGLFPGQTYQFCYTISACNGECEQGIVNIIYPPNYELLTACEVADCDGADLFCYGDFQDFEAGLHYPYYAQLGLENCHLYNTAYFNSPDIIMDNDENIYAQVINSGSNIEILTIPLSNAIQPGCALNLDFDYKRGFGSSAPTVQIFATANEPCQTAGMPSLNPTEGTDYHNILSEGITAVPYYWQSNQLTWLNNTNEPIQFITFINMKEGSGMSKLHLDNISAAADCAQQLSVVEEIESDCIGEEVKIQYEFCLQNIQEETQVNLNIELPVLPGIYLLNETENTITLSEANPCQEVTVALEVESWIPEQTALDINVQLSSPNACIIDGHVVSTSLLLEKCCVAPNAYFNAYANTCGQMTFNAVNELNSTHYWDFGDGNHSTIVNPTHIFAQSGDYTITHTVTNECETSTITEIVTVEECPIEMTCSCPEEGFNIDAGEGTLLSALNLPNMIDGSCVAIKGHLIIDQEWTIRASEVRMQPSSKITVTPYTYLNLYNNNENGGIHSCENMWQGIELTPYANIKLINSTLQDAQYAIQAENESGLIIENSTFDRNYVGVHAAVSEEELQIIRNKWMSGNTFTCTSELLPAYEGQAPAPGMITYAAFAIEDAILDLRATEDYATENVFTNIQNGIVAKNSNLMISEARFQNLIGNSGNAAQPNQLLGIGIILENSELLVEQSHFENLDRAIHATSSATTIKENTIINASNSIVINNGNDLINRIENNELEFANYGVYVSGTNNPDSLLILDNAITSNTFSSTYTGRAIFCLGLGPIGTGTKTIEGNELTLNNRSNGISILNDGGYNVSSNFIVFDQINLSGYSTPSGISIGGSYNNYFYNNAVISNTYSTKVNGFFISSAVNNTFCCNSTDNTRSGFEFFGNCAQTQLRHSEIGNHKIGLKLGYGTMIGDQMNANNRWVGTYTQYAARHYGNSEEIEDSQFYADDSDFELFPSNEVYSSQGNWFINTQSSNLECTADALCQPFMGGQLVANTNDTQQAADLKSVDQSALNDYYNSITNKEISQTDLDELHTIANQCPLERGLLVYKARALYALVAPLSIDEEVCQIEDRDHSASHETLSYNSTAVFPNPASTFVQIKSSHENAVWILSNQLGQQVKLIQLNTAYDVHDLDVSQLNAGLYVWTIRTADTILEKGKLLVQ